MRDFLYQFSTDLVKKFADRHRPRWLAICGAPRARGAAGTVSRMVNIEDTETSEPLFTGQFEHGELRILLHDYTRPKYHRRSVWGIQRDIGVIDPRHEPDAP